MQKPPGRTVIARVAATTEYSPLDVHAALKVLGYSHTTEAAKSGPAQLSIHLGRGRLVAHVTRRLHDIRESICNFIVCSHAEIALLPRHCVMRGNSLTEAVEYAISMEARRVFIRDELTPLEYVAEVSEPSFLNNLQTMMLRVQPYALRKSAEATVLNYLNSKVSQSVAATTLKGNLRTAGLAGLLAAAVPLRNAVAASRRVGTIAAAAEYNVPEFEITYVRKRCDSQ